MDAAFVTALGSILVAVATTLKYRADAKQAAKKVDLDTLQLTFDALRATVDELQEQKAAQQKEIEGLQTKVKEQQIIIEELTQKNEEYERDKLVLTGRVTELAIENEKLHRHINKLRAEMSEQNGRQ